MSRFATEILKGAGSAAIFALAVGGAAVGVGSLHNAQAAPSTRQNPAPGGGTVNGGGCIINGGIVTGNACQTKHITVKKVNIRTTVYKSDPNVGTLKPDNEPMPTYTPTGYTEIDDCFAYAGSLDAFNRRALSLYFGTNISIMYNFPVTLLAMGGEPMIKVDRKGGNIVVDMVRVIDDRDNQIVRIDPNGYAIDPESHVHVSKPDKSSLIVEDHLGRQVLSIRYINSQAIVLDGIFRFPGISTVRFSGNPAENSGFYMGHSCVNGAPTNRPVIDLGLHGSSFGWLPSPPREA